MNGGQLVALDERFLEMADREGLAAGSGTFWLISDCETTIAGLTFLGV